MRPIDFKGRHRRRALWFAVTGNLLPIAIAAATDAGSHRWLFLVGAVGGFVAPLGVTLIPRRRRVLFYLAAFGGIPALTAMQSYTGGTASGYSVLMMMPMVWFGLQATERELIVSLIALVICSFAPMFVIGPPAYPVDWGHAGLLIFVGAAVAGSLHTLSRETHRLTERLRHEATIDDLTGLLNRRGWREAAALALARAERASSPLGVIAIDLDEFKRINDSMGHDVGDRVLTETAGRLREALRTGDVVARLGGDEFVALLIDADLDELLLAVDRLRTLTPPLGAFSAGVSVWSSGEDLDAMLRRTDVALYEAKTNRCTVAVAAHPMTHTL